MKARPFLQGAGLSTLYIALYAADFLSPTLGDAYHRFFPLTSIYRAIFLLALLLWLVGGLAFFVLERLPSSWRRILWIIPTALLPWLVFRALSSDVFASQGSSMPTRMLHLAHTVPVCLAIAVSLLLVLNTKIYDRFISSIRLCYMISGFGLLVIMPQIGLHALKAGPSETLGFQRTEIPNVAEPGPRIIWVLMDELSYDQVFAARQPDLPLPNFDHFAQSSVSFSNIRPPADAPGPGAETEDVLPSLLLGRPIVQLQKTYPGPPKYRSIPNGPWQQFAQNDTIFAEAHASGWTTGVAGWYNPYCRLLSGVLDRCIWVYSEPLRWLDLAGMLSTRNTVAENVTLMLPFRNRLRALTGRTTPNEDVRAHINDYRSMMQHADDLILDSRIRFAFIHLPIPHPPGIYNRSRHTISEHGTYLDNLVLADDTLAALEKTIQTTPAAANTTLIVSSDHSWRPYVWKPIGFWSAEAEHATKGGTFDDRPVLMVHLPGQQAGSVISKPVSLLLVHTIIEGLLRGQIHSPADIENVINPRSQQSIAAQTSNATNVQTGN